MVVHRKAYVLTFEVAWFIIVQSVIYQGTAHGYIGAMANLHCRLAVRTFPKETNCGEKTPHLNVDGSMPCPGSRTTGKRETGTCAPAFLSWLPNALGGERAAPYFHHHRDTCPHAFPSRSLHPQNIPLSVFSQVSGDNKR